MTEGNGPTGVIGADERDVVFLSYARSNASSIAPLVDALQSSGTRLWMDVEDIRPATEWFQEIQAGITNARAFLAILSADYLASDACLDELEFARESGKAIISVALEDLSAQNVPAWLASLHWITWQPGTGVADPASAVTAAVLTDVQWSDLHSQLQGRATAWARRGRTTSELLRGSELDEAEQELALTRPPGQPFPTSLQREYVVASRGHQRRFTRRVVSAVSLVAIVALVLAGLAVWQGLLATRSAEKARQALAKSDFERFRAAEGQAPDLVRRARLSLDAYAAGDRAGFSDASSARPLTEAFGKLADKPTARFEIRPESQAYSGEHEGVAVSGDGSTLAYLGLDGVVHVVAMWTLDEKATFKPKGWSEQALPQIALNFDGTRLLYAAGEADSSGVLREYDVSNSTPALKVDQVMPIGDELAAVAFGPLGRTYTLVKVSGQILIVDPALGQPHVTVLGEHVERSNADVMQVSFSQDANRVCLTGATHAFYQLSKPKLISDNDHIKNCVPEPCAGSAANHIELDPAAGTTCVTPDGDTAADITDCDACTREAGRPSETHYDYRAVVPGPSGHQTIDFGRGVLSILRPSNGTIPIRSATALPHGTQQVWSSNGHPVVVPRQNGHLDAVGHHSPSSMPSDNVVKALWDSPGELLSTGDVAAVTAGSLTVSAKDPAKPDVVMKSGIRAQAWFGDVVALGDGTHVEIWDVAARKRLDTAHLDSNVCAISWSLDGGTLAAAGCSPNGGATVTTWSYAHRRLDPTATTAAPIPAVDTISVSDDGGVVSVSLSSGESAVWRMGKWLPDVGLNSAASESNDYHSGWSMVDRSGSWLLVRKNQGGITLWSVGADGVAPAATILADDPTGEPVVPEFDETTLQLAWVGQMDGDLNGPLDDELDGPQLRTWDLSPRALVKPLCTIAAAGAVRTDPTASEDARYNDPCAGSRPELPDEPTATPPPISTLPVADNKPDALRLHNYDTLRFPPDFGFETIATSLSPTSIISLVGSHRADVDLDDLSVVRAGRIIQGSFKYAVEDEKNLDLITVDWCGGTYRFDLSGHHTQVKYADGQAFVPCNPVAIAHDVLWTVRGSGFEGVGPSGEHVDVKIPDSLATGFVQDLVNVSPDDLVALIQSTDDGTNQLVRLDAVTRAVTVEDATGLLGPLAVASDGTIWGATDKGVRQLHLDGTSTEIAFPSLGRITAMTIDSVGRLWFTTRTTIGLVTADGTVRFNAVHGAKGLSDIVYTGMGDYLAVLDSATNTLIRFSMSEQ